MIGPVIVTVPPTGMSPVHTAPVVPTDRVPELVVSGPPLVASVAMSGALKVTLIPKYGVCPVLVSVVVIFTSEPGVAVATSVVVSIVSCDTVTVALQDVSVVPAGQLLPVVTEVMVLARMWLPVSGLFTVTENVMVAAAPTARFPVQVRFGLAKVTLPLVAA